MRTLVLVMMSIVLGACDQTKLPAEYVPAVLERTAIHLFPDADSVRLLVHDGGYSEDGLQIFSDPDGVRLTQAQRAELHAAFEQIREIKTAVIPPGVEPPMAVAAACFIPHHFFEFLSGEGEVIGRLEVCFCCHGARFTPQPGTIPPGSWIGEDVGAIERLIQGMSLPTDIDCP